jgi:hypothetical protein
MQERRLSGASQTKVIDKAQTVILLKEGLNNSKTGPV